MRCQHLCTFILGTLLLSACSASHVLNSNVVDKKFDKTLPLNYQTVYAEILDRKCANCHGAGSSSKANGKPFAPYATMAEVNPPEKPDLMSTPASKSRMYRAITRLDKHRMPPPTIAGPLTQDEIDFIAEWIDAGKPEF